MPPSAKGATGIKIGPELYFAIVAPVGTPKQPLMDALESNLADVGYSTVPIKLSEILTERATEEIQNSHEERRVGALMDIGDDVCDEAENVAAVALLGVAEIRERRAEHHAPQDTAVQDLEQYRGRSVPRCAYVIDSLKRPGEVTRLRALWGDNLIVVSLKADVERRRKELTEKLEKQRVINKKQVAGAVDQLIERDAREEGRKLGQNVVRAFPLADWFVDVDGDVSAEVQRFVHILFGDPASEPARADEFAMQAAAQAAMLTPELGNRVGAVITDQSGSIIASGANMHPISTDTPKYDESHFNIRELIADTMIKLEQAGQLSEQAAAATAEDQIDHYVSNLILGALQDAKVRDLVEFQLPVHAEMNALLAALRRGAPVDGCRMFVTAHPCHLCAKHLIPLELEVVYLEPYPKSRAAAMYGDNALQHFRPFTGIAPRRFESVFRVSEDRKKSDGTLKTWEKKASLPKVDPFVAIGVNAREVVALQSVASLFTKPAVANPQPE